MPEIALEVHKPNRADAVQLITELDAYLETLYPPEDNYLLDIDLLMRPSIQFILAFVDGEAVGCGAIWVQEGYAEVKRMYVRPTCRGMGIGAGLLSKIEALAREAGITTLRLETGIHQHDSIRLYQRGGYQPCGVFGDYTDNPHSLFYEKRLE